MTIYMYTVKVAIYTVDCIFQHAFSKLTLFVPKHSSSSNIQVSQSVSTISLLSVLALYIHVSNSSIFTLSSQPPV